ncbi:MinD/ParA family protein [Bacillus sp. JJ1764]|uniref:MinD/ParA family protein n=1 Tax=Bacillus sp. JJ1764 TaxID=3122964 RepID=UPI002FFE173E
MDQAQSLREKMNRLQAERPQQLQDPLQKTQYQHHPSSRVITITSGKGGVGKSNFSLNFALGLKAEGKKVVILDLDLSTANLNILMGISPRYSLANVLYDQIRIWDVIEKGTEGIEFIHGGFDLQHLMNFDQSKLDYFWNQLNELQSYADYILLDTGAGISKELVDFILASDETIMVATPEPTSIADAYTVLKTVMSYTTEQPKLRLVINRAQTYQEAVETSRAFQHACKTILKLEIQTLGYLLEDLHVRQSVKAQKPFLVMYPNSTAAKNMKQIIYSYLPEFTRSGPSSSKGIRGFFEKIWSRRK